MTGRGMGWCGDVNTVTSDASQGQPPMGMGRGAGRGFGGGRGRHGWHHRFHETGLSGWQRTELYPTEIQDARPEPHDEPEQQELARQVAALRQQVAALEARLIIAPTAEENTPDTGEQS